MIQFTWWETLIILAIFGWPLYGVIAALAAWVRLAPLRFSSRLRTAALVCLFVFIPAFAVALWAWASYEFADPNGAYYDTLHRRTLTHAETIDRVTLPPGTVVHYRYGVPSWVDIDRPFTLGDIRVLRASASVGGFFQWNFYQDMRVDPSSADALRLAGCNFTKAGAGGSAYLLMMVGQPAQCIRAFDPATLAPSGPPP